MVFADVCVDVACAACVVVVVVAFTASAFSKAVDFVDDEVGMMFAGPSVVFGTIVTVPSDGKSVSFLFVVVGGEEWC